MNCQDVNSLGAGNFINDTIVAVDNFSNLVLSSHFRYHSANSWICLKKWSDIY